MADVAVLGAGLVGQLAAILLARRGHQVVLFDSDGDIADGTVDGQGPLPRPQFEFLLR